MAAAAASLVVVIIVFGVVVVVVVVVSGGVSIDQFANGFKDRYGTLPAASIITGVYNKPCRDAQCPCKADARRVTARCQLLEQQVKVELQQKG